MAVSKTALRLGMMLLAVAAGAVAAPPAYKTYTLAPGFTYDAFIDTTAEVRPIAVSVSIWPVSPRARAALALVAGRTLHRARAAPTARGRDGLHTPLTARPRQCPHTPRPRCPSRPHSCCTAG